MLANITEAYPSLSENLKACNPIDAAMAFAGMLTMPQLQSNAFRLEILVHLSLQIGAGASPITGKIISDGFNALSDGPCGASEDPAEDLFIGLIRTPYGNYRIHEGIWEGGSFLLQRFINIVNRMPVGGGYDDLRDSIYALLKLSERACERLSLARYEVGNRIPNKSLSPGLTAVALTRHKALAFTKDDLDTLGISLHELSPFLFPIAERDKLLQQEFGATLLEHRPIIFHKGNIHFLLPTATSVAIRKYLISSTLSRGMREVLQQAVCSEYRELLSKTYLLGGSSFSPPRFQHVSGAFITSGVTEIDKGRHLQFIFLIDDLSEIEKGWFASPTPDSEGPLKAVDWLIDATHAKMSGLPGFVDGTSLVVGCGVGRPLIYDLPHKPKPNWRLQAVSVNDLETLSWLPRFKPLSLWRILDAQQQVERLGVSLHNINGLLNLVGWVRELDGYLVPPGVLSDDFVREDASSFVSVDQTALLNLRQEVADVWDAHVLQDIDGNWINVRKEGNSFFKEDAEVPHYVDEETPFRGVYSTLNRNWWCELETPQAERRVAYHRWRMIDLWLKRSAPVLDAEFPNLPSGHILWRTRFDGEMALRQADYESINFVQTKKEIKTSIDRTRNSIKMHCSSIYERAFANIENIAEKALVEAFVDAVSKLARTPLSSQRRDELVAQIIPGSMARQTHAFRNLKFRDHVTSSLPSSAIYIEREDDAAFRLGLGWKAREKHLGGSIDDKASCIAFLNQLVQVMEIDLIAMLRSFNRREAILSILQNYETVAVEVNRWRRTSAAILALHNDKSDVLKTLAEHEFKLNAVALGSRILIEAAICECPLKGGLGVGELDLSRLLSLASLIFNFGGYSDAIRWDVMQPRLRITPLGDVHANWDFLDQIIEPFAQAASDVRVSGAVDGYSELVDTPNIVPAGEEGLDGDFLSALDEAFGAPFNQLRLFVDHVENLGIENEKAVFLMPLSQLLSSVAVEQLDAETAIKIVRSLKFFPRPSWREVPSGFKQQDRQPWRFRRRLSVLRRPLLFLDTNDDPMVVVAPGLIREAFAYMVGNYLRGDFPDDQLSSKMLLWKGRRADKRGKEFTVSVSERLQSQGWETEIEVPITKLLRQGFDLDYGDVDVLAWKRDGTRILIIECKDLQYRKTYGEMAEQLSDYRGELNSGKPDYLLRHLRRVDLLKQHRDRVYGYVKIPEAPKIESHLIFRNPVPIKFALKSISEKVDVRFFSEIETI